MAESFHASEAWIRGLQRLNLDPGLLVVAQELARMADGSDPDSQEQLALAALLALVAQSQGHTEFPLEGPELEALKSIFETPELDLKTLLADPRLQPFVGTPEQMRPLVVDGSFFTTGRLRFAEVALAREIRFRNEVACAEIAISAEVFAQPVILSEEQRSAVRMAVANPITLISGGPGTGKTSIVRAILRSFLKDLDRTAEDVALAAPTGRAATRLAEALGGRDEDLPVPRTLHRLLGWQPATGQYRFHGENPLSAWLVIVDEASMVGLELMTRLLNALRSGARLVLLGDADQLPSVEAGSTFRDLVQALPQHTCRLTHSYRMNPADPAGRAILSVAEAVKEGRLMELDETLLPRRSSLDALRDMGVECLDGDARTLATFLERWAERYLWTPELDELLREPFRMGQAGWAEGETTRFRRAFDHFGRVRLLCPLRQTPGLKGAEAVNLFLHDRWSARTGKGLAKELAFLAGEPVVMRKNDYRRGLFNGDPGWVVQIARLGEDVHQAVVFPKGIGFSAHPLGPLLGDLELGYASTVHRAQGSEYDHVGLILPSEDMPLLTREILYTALTRARKSVAIIGSRETLEQASEKCIRRFAALGRLLG